MSGRRSGSTLRAASLFHDANLTDWVYTPDSTRPVDPVEYNRNYQFRTTFQLAKDKFGASTDIQRHYRDQAFGQLDQGIARIEANAAMCHNDSLTQFTWSRPQSNTMLFEGGGSVSLNAFGTANFGTALDGSDYEECGQSQPFRVNIADAARGANYHGVGAIGIGISNLFVGRFATSYVTGAHNFKAGLYFIRGNVTGNTINRADDVGGLPISYTFTNGVPTALTEFAGPWHRRAHGQRHGAVCAGFVDAAAADPQPRPAYRLDQRSRVGEVDHPANALFAAYTTPAVESTPNWKDLSPRVGAAYDLFGNGKTAIKGGINRYVAGASTGVASLYGPTATSSTTRNWTDSNGNFFPDCDLKNGGGAEPDGHRRRHLRRLQHAERWHLRPEPERDRRRLHAGVVQARLQLARDGLGGAAARPATGRGGHLCPRDLRQLPGDRQPQPDAGGLRSVLHHAAGGSAPVAERPAAVRPLRPARQRARPAT